MQFEAKLTLDGLMTLIAGIIAFGAVIIQIRSSSKQVQEQIKAQRVAAEAEQERQIHVVARALLFEIDGIYRWLLRDVRNFLRDVEPETEDLKLVEAKPVGTNPYVIYEGNASRLGELDELSVENVVRFYMGAQACLYSIKRYDDARGRYLANQTEETEDFARQWLGNVKNSIPPLIIIVHEVCQRLCTLLSVEFEAPRIAVAGEDMDSVKQEIIKIGDGGIYAPNG